MPIHEDSERPGPRRACAACRTRRPVAELLRFVRRGALVVLDPRRRQPGRGLNLCPSQGCLRRAAKRGAFRRGLGLGVEVDTLERELVATLGAALGDCLRGGRQPDHLVEVDALSEVEPTALRPLVEAGVAPAVRVSSPRLARRVSLLASAIDEFTFKGPGVMKRPAERADASPDQTGAISPSPERVAERTETAPNSENA